MKNELFFYHLMTSGSYEKFKKEIDIFAEVISPRIIDESECNVNPPSEEFLNSKEFTDEQKKWAQQFFAEYRGKERRSVIKGGQSEPPKEDKKSEDNLEEAAS